VIVAAAITADIVAACRHRIGIAASQVVSVRHDSTCKPGVIARERQLL
jgi:hypothetical protein